MHGPPRRRSVFFPPSVLPRYTMSMTTFIVLLGGILIGCLLMWRVMAVAERKALRPHMRDVEYDPAKRAVIVFVRAHGTVNLTQVERMLDLRSMTALRYLEQMVHDGILKQQGHRGPGTFYTLV